MRVVPSQIGQEKRFILLFKMAAWLTSAFKRTICLSALLRGLFQLVLVVRSFRNVLLSLRVDCFYTASEPVISGSVAFVKKESVKPTC